MNDVLLYPTETLYALGVNALDDVALKKLYTLKGRSSKQVASWLVRDIRDIEQYAVVTDTVHKVVKAFLPGSLTLVLRVKDSISDLVVAPDRTIGFRITSDPIAQKTVADFMKQYCAPLTCTSANVHGAPTFGVPGEILQQFGEKASMITEIIDDGVRKGLASTVVRIIDDQVEVLREGEITEEQILDIVHT